MCISSKSSNVQQPQPFLSTKPALATCTLVYLYVSFCLGPDFIPWHCYVTRTRSRLSNSSNIETLANTQHKSYRWIIQGLYCLILQTSTDSARTTSGYCHCPCFILFKDPPMKYFLVTHPGLNVFNRLDHFLRINGKNGNIKPFDDYHDIDIISIYDSRLRCVSFS